MVDGIDAVRGPDESERIVKAAQGAFVRGEEPVVTAARRIVRDHERDPVDGTIRVFGGADEGRLASAVSRIPTGTPEVVMEGRLGADVAIQRVAAQRERDLVSGRGARPTQAEARDADALRGDVTGIATEASRLTAGSLAAGRFDMANDTSRKWIQDSVAFAGRQAGLEARMPAMAGTGRVSIASLAADGRASPVRGASTGAKGPSSDGPSAAMAHVHRSGGMGR